MTNSGDRTDTAAPPVSPARLAEQHAFVLERLAVVFPLVGLVAGIYLAGSREVGLGALVVVGGIVLWAVLRALGLSLRLGADRARRP